jgi:hypothetical protein
MWSGGLFVVVSVEFRAFGSTGVNVGDSFAFSELGRNSLFFGGIACESGIAKDATLGYEGIVELLGAPALFPPFHCGWMKRLQMLNGGKTRRHGHLVDDENVLQVHKEALVVDHGCILEGPRVAREFEARAWFCENRHLRHLMKLEFENESFS